MTDAFPMEWRVCPRFPEWEVSECGDLRRVAPAYNRPVGYRLKGSIDSDGYLRYSIQSDGEKCGVTAYRLVAEAFIGPPPSSSHEVAHCNGSRISCDYRYLRWATRKQNDDDTRVHGTDRKGSRNGRAKISEDDVQSIRREYRLMKQNKVPKASLLLANRYGLNRGTVLGIARGNHWSHLPMEAA